MKLTGARVKTQWPGAWKSPAVAALSAACTALRRYENGEERCIACNAVRGPFARRWRSRFESDVRADGRAAPRATDIDLIKCI